MSARLVQFTVPEDKDVAADVVCTLDPVISVNRFASHDGRMVCQVLVSSEDVQQITDKIQSLFIKQTDTRVLVMQLSATMPPIEEDKEKKDKVSKDAGEKKKKFLGISREELHAQVIKNAKIDLNFLILVCLSTIVASIGLLMNDVAVVIGAMVIAPLLGPNLCLALATALGDSALAGKAIRTNLVGLGLSLVLSLLIGLVWNGALDSPELLSRTMVGYPNIILAIASGAAAVLSMATGTSSALVGVMVAVALLPPASTLGIMLGAGHLSQAYGAFMLLAVNIVCVNLSAKVVFLLHGVEPRTWYEKQKAKSRVKWNAIFWVISLTILSILIALKL